MFYCMQALQDPQIALYYTFHILSGAGMIKPALRASCFTVINMFLSFSSTYLGNQCANRLEVRMCHLLLPELVQIFIALLSQLPGLPLPPCIYNTHQSNGNTTITQISLAWSVPALSPSSMTSPFGKNSSSPLRAGELCKQRQAASALQLEHEVPLPIEASRNP